MTHPFLDIGIYHMLVVSFLILAAGITTITTRRNAIGVLMGVELIVNAAALNFVSFWRFIHPDSLDGYAFTMFIIVLAAAEAAIALAIVLNYYHNNKSVDIDKADSLAG